MSIIDKADAIEECIEQINVQLRIHEGKIAEELAVVTSFEKMRDTFESMKPKYETITV